MSQSYVEVWIHAVFSTKHRNPLIRPEFEEGLHRHMRDYLDEVLRAPVAAINGTADHLHLLFRLPTEQRIMDIMKHVKGESSHWVNQQDLMPQKFAWQSGYGAFSVDRNAIEPVVRYIREQKEHHRVKTYEDECRELFDGFIMESDESDSTTSGTNDKARG